MDKQKEMNSAGEALGFAEGGGDLVAYLEMARRAMADADMFDRMGEEMDLSDEEMRRLREQLQEFLAGPVETLEVPRVWAELLKIEEFGEDVRAGDKFQKAEDDPTPYHDDRRDLGVTFEDGTTFTLGLHSGQTNYYLIGEWSDPTDEEETEPMHDLTDGQEFDREGADHKVVIKLV